MYITMQGNWTVTVKSKSAAFDQRFVIRGATSGNGVHAGTQENSVNVTGNQWAIAVQNDPGSGFQLSDSKITFPRKVGNRYQFDIQTNDAGGDQDFNDLILTCSTPATIFDYILYGNVTLYSGKCFINPCWQFPIVIDTYEGLLAALKNPKIKDLIVEKYPERIPDLVGPEPPNPQPDPTYFRPIVLEHGESKATSKTRHFFEVKETGVSAGNKGKTKKSINTENIELIKSEAYQRGFDKPRLTDQALVKDISDLLLWHCHKEPARHISLTFEEYDPTFSELNGGAYVGNGNRELLGDTITDRHGNYIFRFKRFRFFPPFGTTPETTFTTAPDWSFNNDLVAQPFYFDNPDIIVKVNAGSPLEVVYESAPYYDIPHLKRINLCFPKSRVRPTSMCFNGNLIGSLGNVFIGGNQNTSASTSQLLRDGYNNVLTADGKVTVHSSLSGIAPLECAAWRGTVDMKGCMYDLSKSPSQNKVEWYTIRVKRAGTSQWEFVSQNYKHPRFSKRALPNYTGDDVGPFLRNLKVDGGTAVSRPAYINIQREVYAEGQDWEFSNLDRYMRLVTSLYDKKAGGIREPGTHYVRVDGYDASGNPVPGATDMIALFIHNIPLNMDINGNGSPNFSLSPMVLDDSSIIYDACGLYRLADDEMRTPLQFSYIADDPYGFLNSYTLTMGRCPVNTLEMTDADGNAVALSGSVELDSGQASNIPNVYRLPNGTVTNCPGYKGTSDEHPGSGLVNVQLTPNIAWIGASEYYTRLSLHLEATMRVTNGYNNGISSPYRMHRQIAMEKLNP